MTEERTLLEVKDLKLYFKTESGDVQAVDNVDFTLPTNKAVVVVGESGCGKSSLAKAILRLLPQNAGESTDPVQRRVPPPLCAQPACVPDCWRARQ